MVVYSDLMHSYSTSNYCWIIIQLVDGHNGELCWGFHHQSLGSRLLQCLSHASEPCSYKFHPHQSLFIIFSPNFAKLYMYSSLLSIFSNSRWELLHLPKLRWCGQRTSLKVLACMTVPQFNALSLTYQVAPVNMNFDNQSAVKLDKIYDACKPVSR